jgi:hypothetical protein
MTGTIHFSGLLDESEGQNEINQKEEIEKDV